MQYKQKTDAELVVLLTLNDEEAFSELYVRYKSKLQYFCFHFLKVESEACDIVQEVLLIQSSLFLPFFMLWLGIVY